MSGAQAKIGGVRPSFIVFFGSVALLVLFVLFQPEREEIDPKALPWNAQFNQDGKLETLGITLNETLLREAMLVYGKDVEIRLFTDRDGSNKTAEAYFPTMYIGSIKAAAAVTLNIPDDRLETVYNRGAKISPTTSGGKEIKLSSDDNLAFLDLSISSITLLPRKNLTERSIDLRFGPAARSEVQEDGLERRFYPELGLELIIDPDGPEALQYSMP